MNRTSTWCLHSLPGMQARVWFLLHPDSSLRGRHCCVPAQSCNPFPGRASARSGLRFDHFKSEITGWFFEGAMPYRSRDARRNDHRRTGLPRPTGSPAKRCGGCSFQVQDHRAPATSTELRRLPGANEATFKASIHFASGAASGRTVESFTKKIFLMSMPAASNTCGKRATGRSRMAVPHRVRRGFGRQVHLRRPQVHGSDRRGGAGAIRELLLNYHPRCV